MGVDGGSPADAGRSEPVTLSTGETVELPLETEATMVGAVFAVSRTPVQKLLPEGIRPIRATPSGHAAVTFLSVEYHRIGNGEIDPYNEFAVILPAVHESATTVPYLSALTRGTSGYIWYLPVTTDPAKALGVDIWGFPKVVADITHEDHGSRRQTTVTLDGERFITMELTRPPALHLRDDGYTYSVTDGEVLCVPTEVDGDVEGWPFSDEVTVSFGSHPGADPLRDVDLGDRALARVSVDGDARFYPGEPVIPK